MDIQELAKQLFDAFEIRARYSGETFVCLRDTSPEWMTDAIRDTRPEWMTDAIRDTRPEWMTDAIRDAHDGGGRLPCDRVYTLVMEAAEHIAEVGHDPDGSHDFADAAVSVYTADRYRWLAEHLTHGELCDEAAESGFVGEDATLAERIGAGMYLQAGRVYAAVLQALEQQAEEG